MHVLENAVRAVLYGSVDYVIQHLLPSWSGDAGRSCFEERNPDCPVRERIATAGSDKTGGGRTSRAHSFASHHVEIFNGSEAMTPGVISAPTRTPHLPNDDANTGPAVFFARSGIAAHWKPSAYHSILELAEACDIPVRWSCRTGVCHSCESGLISGSVVYGPEPLDKPADGNLLICCSKPIRDVVVDL